MALHMLFLEHAVTLPDAPTGVVTPFEVTGPVMPDDQSQYTIVGVYDVVGGGVSVALNPASDAGALGKAFGAVFGDFSESDIAGELQGGGQFFDTRTQFSGVLKGPSTDFPIVDFTPLGNPSTIIDFTTGTLNGSAFVQPCPIPEPATIVLVLLASVCAARRMNYPVVAHECSSGKAGLGREDYWRWTVNGNNIQHLGAAGSGQSRNACKKSSASSMNISASLMRCKNNISKER